MSERLLTPAERSAKETQTRTEGQAIEARAIQLESEVSDLLKQQQAVPMTGQIQQGTKQEQGIYAGFSHNHRPVFVMNNVPNYVPYYSPEEQQKITEINKQIQAKQQQLTALGRETTPVQAPTFLQPDTKYSGGNVSVNYEGTLAARQAGFDVGSGLTLNLPETFQKEEDKKLYQMNKDRLPTVSATPYNPFQPVEAGGLFDINTKAPKIAGYSPETKRGYNPITKTVTPQNPRKTIERNQPGKLFGNQTIPTYDAIDMGLAPESKPPFGASIKSVVSPIAYTPLRGTNVTARNYNVLKNQPATTENLLGVVGKPTVTKTISSPVGGNATKAIQAQLKYNASIQNRPAEIGGFNLLPSAFAETQPGNIDYSGIESTLNEIRQKGGRQVTITSPSGKKTTIPIDQAINVIKGSPQQGSYGFEYLPAPTAEQRATKIQVLKGNQQKILSIIDDAKATGTNEITIIEKGGKRTTVPLSRAFYDITKSFKTSPELSFEYGGISAQEKNASISAIQKNAVTQISDFTKQAKADFADEITIRSEDGTTKTIPLAQAQLEIRRATAGGKKVELSYVPLPKPITLTDAAKEVERITGLGGIATPGLGYIDKALQLNLPYQKRSKEARLIPGVPSEYFSGISNYEIGKSFAPIANFGAEVYDFTKATAQQIKAQYPFVEAPNKGSIFPRLKTTQTMRGETPFVTPPPSLENILGVPVPRKQTPQQQTPLGDIFAGKPIDITESGTQASLAGEAALQAGLLYLTGGFGVAGEAGLRKAGKIKDTNVKLKVIESYEIPDVMRKPPGEGMRPLSDLYKETVKLKTPEQMTIKQMAEANLAANIFKARTEDVFRQGAGRYAGRFNPKTGKIQGEVIGIDLGIGKGFVPKSGGGGGITPGDLGGLPPPGGATVKVTKITDEVKITPTKGVGISPPTPDIFTMDQYADLGKANPKIQTTSLGPIGGVGDVFRLEGKEIKPIPEQGPYRFFEKLRAMRKNPQLEERELFKFYPKESGKFGNAPVEPIDLTGRVYRTVPTRMVNLGEGKVIRRPYPRVDFGGLAIGLLKPYKPKGGVGPSVNIPTLNIKPLGEVKPSKRETRKPGLKLLQKNEIENQIDKILKLDISTAKLERAGITSVKVNLGTGKGSKINLKKSRFASVYKTQPEAFPALYEKQNAKLLRIRNVGKMIQTGTPVIINPKVFPQTKTKAIQLKLPKTRTKLDTGFALINIPKTGYPPITETLTVPALDIPQKRKTRTSLLNIPDQPTELITELRFPKEPPPQRAKGGFFLPPGGGGGGGFRRGRRTRKIFYTNPSDPLRAGVILAQGVPELESYSPKIFKQVDVLLAKSRKRNKWAGLDQPYQGLKIKDTLSKNINIKI